MNAYSLLAAGAALSAVIGFSAMTGCENPTGNRTDGGDPEVAAAVNGVNIPVSKIDQMIERQTTDRNGNRVALEPVELAAARMQALQQLIQEEALFQRAQKEGVVPTDEELKNEIQAQKQQLGMTEDQFQQYLKQLGQSEAEFTEQAKRQLAIKKLQDKVALKVQTPTEDELRKTFEANKAQAIAPRGVELADIVVDPAPNGASDDATTPEAAQRKAQEIEATLKSGADFATVARARSEDPNSAMQGGSLGFVSDDQLKQTFPPEIVAKFYGMQAGQVTEPVPNGRGGWHIFKVGQKREQSQPLTFEEVRQQLAQQMIDQRKQLVVSALYLDAIANASVKNYLAERILEHPDTFGALRESALTKPAVGSGAPAQPSAQPAQATAQPSGAPAATGQPANANTKK